MSDFIKEYLERGFGVMTKKEIEMAIFEEILLANANSSDFQLSQILKTTESKVKALRHEYNSRHPKDPEEYKEDVKQVLNDAAIRKKDNKIQFRVSDKVLRSYIDDVLKAGNRFFDTSFNSELIVMDNRDFSFLLKHVFGEEDVKAVEDKAKKASREGEGIYDENGGISWIKVVEALANVTNAVVSPIGGVMDLLSKMRINK